MALVKDRQGMTYASREDVKRALDIKETARADDQIDRALRAASDTVEGMLHRRFYPEVRTQTFDWPDPLGTTSLPWTLYFDRHDVIDITTVTTGLDATVIDSGDYFLKPDDGPPFERLELDVNGDASFDQNAGGQNSITVSGTFGWTDETDAVGSLTTGPDASTTTFDVSEGTAEVGVGDMLQVEDERVTVTEKGFLDSTEDLADDVPVGGAVSITVTDGSAFTVGEVLLIDAERMLVTDINGNALAVVRGWDGSTMAAHSSGADVLVSRRLTVRRGVLGTTAAVHGAVTVSKLRVPPLVRDLTIAEALTVLLQERTGYARVIGQGEGESEVRGVGLADLRDQAVRTYGRKKGRGRAV